MKLTDNEIKLLVRMVENSLINLAKSQSSDTTEELTKELRNLRGKLRNENTSRN